jgi:hypothetical protein
VKFVATKKAMTKSFLGPYHLLLFLDPGYGIQDPGSGMGKIQDTGSGIIIPDPQHWLKGIGFFKVIEGLFWVI